MLMMLSNQPLHGYGIVKASREDSGCATLELGSLYRIIGRMMAKGLIEDAPTDQPNSKRPRRYYRTTELGRNVVRAEAARLRLLLSSEHAALLLEER